MANEIIAQHEEKVKQEFQKDDGFLCYYHPKVRQALVDKIMSGTNERALKVLQSAGPVGFDAGDRLSYAEIERFYGYMRNGLSRMIRTSSTKIKIEDAYRRLGPNGYRVPVKVALAVAFVIGDTCNSKNCASVSKRRRIRYEAAREYFSPDWNEYDGAGYYDTSEAPKVQESAPVVQKSPVPAGIPENAMCVTPELLKALIDAAVQVALNLRSK